MNGMLVASGQNFVVDTMVYYINNIISGVYVGLMTTEGLPSESAQLGAGLTEITGTGYSRTISQNWYKSTGGVDPVIQGDPVTFVVPSGETWANVNGYFVCLHSGAAYTDAIWSEEFSTLNKGSKTQGERMIITPRFEEKYYGEV